MVKVLGGQEISGTFFLCNTKQFEFFRHSACLLKIVNEQLMLCYLESWMFTNCRITFAYIMLATKNCGKVIGGWVDDAMTTMLDIFISNSCI